MEAFSISTLQLCGKKCAIDVTGTRGNICVIRLSNGPKVWVGELSDECITSASRNSTSMAKVKTSLSGGEGGCTLSLKDGKWPEEEEEEGLDLVVKEEIGDKKGSRKIASLTLTLSPNCEEDVINMFGDVASHLMALVVAGEDLKRENVRLTSLVSDFEKAKSIDLKVKGEEEKAMFQNFCRVLNEKKLKMQEIRF